MPRRCAACNKILTAEEKTVCSECNKSLISADKDFLAKEYSRKFLPDKFIDAFYSAFIFKDDNPIREILHKLKYSKNFRAGIFFGEKIADKFFDEITNFNADFIIPVPLHKIKKAERGYNQSFYIAKGVNKKIPVKIRTDILKRKKYTETQTQLSSNERKANVANAFLLRKPKVISNKKIILIDDVTTTGATTSEIAKLLKSNGAEKILLLTAAIPVIE